MECGYMYMSGVKAYFLLSKIVSRKHGEAKGPFRDSVILDVDSTRKV